MNKTYLSNRISAVKKSILALTILSLIISCNRQNDAVPTKANERIKTVRSGADGKWDVLGYGFDVTGDIPDIYSVSDSRIFNLDRFYADHPTWIDVNDVGEGSEDFDGGSTALDYLKEVTVDKNAGFNGNYNWGEEAKDQKKYLFSFNFSKNSFDQTKNSYSNRYSYASYKINKRIRKIRFTGEATTSILMQYLTPDFINNVSTLSPAALVERYGTHILLDINLGGILRFDYSGSLYSTTDYTQKKSQIKAGLGFSVLKIVGINLNTDKTTTEVQQIVNATVDKEYRAKYYGGTNSGRSVAIDKDGNTSENISIAGWQSSVTPTNAALIGVDKAVFIYDFIADPVKKAQVKAAVEAYIDAHQPTEINEPIQGSGIPADWSARAKLISSPVPADAVFTNTAPILSSNGKNTIYSQNRQYRLALQSDGNLVLYNASGVGLWNSKTNNSASGWTYRLYYAPDGNLILKKVTSAGAEADIWASYTEARRGTADYQNARRAYLSVQNDGNVALYYSGFNNGVYSLEYSTATAGGRVSTRQGSFK